MVEQKHVEKMADGGLRYRRRFPREVFRITGKNEFRRKLKSSGGTALTREIAKLEAEFLREVGSILASERVTVSSQNPGSEPHGLTHRETWKAAQGRARNLLESAQGIDEDEARTVIAEGILSPYPVDPEEGYPVDVSVVDALTVRAIMQPDAPNPVPTLADARKLYISEKLAGNGDPQAITRLDRILGRVVAVLGPLDTIRLDSLKREDARRVRAEMLDTPRQGGGTLSVSTVKRELNIIKAVVSFGIAEFDLRGTAQNPFVGLEVASGRTGLRELRRSPSVSPFPLTSRGPFGGA